MERGAIRYDVRKWIAWREEIERDIGERADIPLVRALSGVTIRNPFAGSFRADLSDLTTPSADLGFELASRGLSILGTKATSYGKGGIAGTNGEQEHVVACITTTFGDALREALGGGAAWIPSVTKRAGPGESLDVPLAHKDALYVRSHYDAVTVSVADVPLPDELFICVALANRGRVDARVGGLGASDIIGDGLR